MDDEAQEDRRLTAVHEAGHAVARMVLGMPAFRYVTISGRGVRGRVVVRPVRVNPYDSVVCALAGPVAQAYETWRGSVGELVHGQDEDGCTFDDHVVGAYLTGGHDDLQAPCQPFGPDYVSFALVPTVLLVRQNWSAVQALAERLLEKGTVTHREAREACPDLPDGFIPEGPGWDAVLIFSPDEGSRTKAAQALGVAL